MQIRVPLVPSEHFEEEYRDVRDQRIIGAVAASFVARVASAFSAARVRVSTLVEYVWQCGVLVPRTQPL